MSFLNSGKTLEKTKVRIPAQLRGDPLLVRRDPELRLRLRDDRDRLRKPRGLHLHGEQRSRLPDLLRRLASPS